MIYPELVWFRITLRALTSEASFLTFTINWKSCICLRLPLYSSVILHNNDLSFSCRFLLTFLFTPSHPVLTENHILAFGGIQRQVPPWTRLWFSGCGAPQLLNYQALSPTFPLLQLLFFSASPPNIFSNPSLAPDSCHKNLKWRKNKSHYCH